jgi:glycosyltransferase involved in cell wall biosynthesis
MVSTIQTLDSRDRGMPPPVSIGLPVFNGARFISEALDSLLAQTYSDFELIISDNASTDATRSICEEYAARDERVRYVRHEVNRGLAWNWNHAFELSRGIYFKWAACDDLYHPTFLARCLEILKENPDVAWCHTLGRHIDSKGMPLVDQDAEDISHVHAVDGRKKSWCRTSDRLSRRFKAVLLGQSGLDCYGVIRSEILRKTALFLPCFGAEKVFTAELALRGRYYEVPEVLYFARLHEEAAGNLQSRAQQRRLMNPFKTRWHSDRLSLLCWYFAAVKRAGLSPGNRLRCYLAIGRYLMQVRKWKSVLKKAITGAGLAQYPTTLIQQSKNEPTEIGSSTQYAFGKMLNKLLPHHE